MRGAPSMVEIFCMRCAKLSVSITPWGCADGSTSTLLAKDRGRALEAMEADSKILGASNEDAMCRTVAVLHRWETQRPMRRPIDTQLTVVI
mmetsp:Transcript_21217/g.38078  ORF Transcript_21217/g.38078 Transcript_21217/m.38078 type:complete len:91 (+) Transcript_21217:275-547(+)